MKQTPPVDLLDDVGEIKRIMDSTPPNPLKVLEAEYEIALTLLAARLPLGGAGECSEQEEKLAKRLARHFLFNYYTGFSLLKFIPAFDRKGDPTARQLALEDAILRLASLEPARELMAEWFTAALERRLHRTLREFLNASKFTVNPGRAWSRTAARIGLADDLEVIGGMSESVYKTVDFGVSGFHLIFKSTGSIRPQEFDALLAYARRAFGQHREDRIPDVVDVARVLSVPSLSIDQNDALVRFIGSILDFGEFPLDAPDDEIDDPVARAEAVAKQMGFSPPVRAVVKLVVKIFEKRLREEASRSRETRKYYHPHPDQEELGLRKLVMARLAGILSNQSDRFLLALEETDLVPEVIDPLANNSGPDLSSRQEILCDTLLSALKHSPSFTILAKWLQRNPSITFSEDTLQALRDSDLTLDRPVVEVLIGLVAQQPFLPWVTQILENLPNISDPAERCLAQIVQTEKNPTVLGAIIALHENLRQRQPPSELQSALTQRLMQLSLDVDARLNAGWLAWLAGLGREQLRRTLTPIAKAFSNDDSGAYSIRRKEMLRELSRCVDEMKNPEAAVLAACWLADPDDWMRSGNSLAARIERAAAILNARDGDQSAQEQIARILAAAIWRRPQSRSTIARSLKTLRLPDAALPLAQRLLELTADEEGGSWDWSSRETRRQLYTESVKALAALNPLRPGAMLALQRELIASQDDSSVHREITPDFVYTELLPLLVHDVSSDAVLTLVELVWQTHCGPVVNGRSPCVDLEDHSFLKKFEKPSWTLAIGEKVHRYLHNYVSEGFYADGETLLCSLQALANVRSLGVPQQRVIWRVYRTSWHALTKSLCLLVLGRQRPIREETVRELIGLLHRDPSAEFWKTTINHVFRYSLFRLIDHAEPPDSDFNYLYLCQSVAVNLIGVLLKQETDDPIVAQYRHRLEDALLKPTSMSRYGMEPHMSGYTSMGSDTSGMKGIAQMMGVSQEEGEKPTWMAQPADQAYRALRDIVSARPM